MHVTLVFNLKDESGSVDDQPPSLSERPFDDIYAEWDDAHTIEAVRAALATKYRVSMVSADLNSFTTLRAMQPDLVFNIAEGLRGASREAQVPAMLDMLGIPYTGSDPVTLGICLDKQRTKEILSYHRVPTPKFTVIRSLEELPKWNRFPLMVKPTHEGSSKGVTDKALVRNRKELRDQVEWALTHYNQPLLIEEFLPGREFTVAMIGNGDSLQVLPIIEICFDHLPEGSNPIYSYEAKWIWDTEEEPLPLFACPAPLEDGLREEIETICRQAFDALGCRDWCRIDVRLDVNGRPQIIELNPLPGVLPNPEQNSCFPKAARTAGMSYTDMIIAVAEAARARLGLAEERENARQRML